MLRDDSKEDIVSIYEVPLDSPPGDTIGISFLRSVYAAVRYSDRGAFMVEHPNAKAVMLPPAVLFRSPRPSLPDSTSNDLGGGS